MDLDTLKQILNLVREHELSELEVEQDGLRLKIRKDSAVVAPAPPPPMPARAGDGAPAPAAAALAAPQAPSSLESADAEIELAVVKSPIVGTFYRSPEPGAAPFADVGAIVKKGQVLCIIEAMKLMNEIESDVDGVVTRIYPQNGQPIEYGEKLFSVKLS